MTTAKDLLWIDAHMHVRAHSQEGGPCDITLDDILPIANAGEGDVRWVCTIDFPEMGRVKGEPEAVLWASEGLDELIGPAKGRLYGSCIVHAGAVRESRQVLDRFVGERGFVQAGEVHGPAWGPEMDCPGMVELVRHAAELGAPVQLDCPTSSRATGRLQQVFNLARAVPEANLIAAHTIAGEATYANILAGETYFAEGGENVYFEISDFSRRDYVRAAYERLGPDRLVVGTDWHTYDDPPFLPYGILLGLRTIDECAYPCTVESLIGFLQEAGVTDEDLPKIASGNLLRILPIDP